MWIFGLHSADTIHEASNATATGRTIQDLRSWRVPNRTTFQGWTFPNRPNQARPPGGARGARGGRRGGAGGGGAGGAAAGPPLPGPLEVWSDFSSSRATLACKGEGMGSRGFSDGVGGGAP